MNCPPPARCPRLIAIVDEPTCRTYGVNWEDAALATSADGARVVLLRAHEDASAWHRLSWQRLRVEAPDTTWLVAGALAWTEHADGLHLRQHDPPLAALPLDGAFCGRSVHDGHALQRAHAERDRAGRGFDWVTVSPFRAPSYAPDRVDLLGLDRVAALVEAAGTLPVVALGGVSPPDVAALARVGVGGVAALGVFCQPDRAHARALVAAVEACYGGTGWR